jgi:hypothetical protein
MARKSQKRPFRPSTQLCHPTNIEFTAGLTAETATGGCFSLCGKGLKLSIELSKNYPIFL